ncbi:Putative Transmembrane protein 42 [Podospora comata]|uniref:Transmembrane protein 42 n=1 Tax=Podospora comata TaxID=48703 RepID=A0ABY6SGU7_PODCO|nr:Putative Transmembrane protein 42 [Podospora comata]
MPTTRQQAQRRLASGLNETTTTSSAVTSSSDTKVTSLKKRAPPNQPTVAEDEKDKRGMSRLSDEERPLLPEGTAVDGGGVPSSTASWTKRNEWIVYALASGACAAFNGVFAKLTTTELTTTLSMWIARLVGLEKAEGIVEVGVRGSFFSLNLVFNGIMWTLFTKALSKGNSTTQVSIMNTSCNFFITAILSFAIFSEALPPLWWMGAAMLVAGNVIIGSKDEGVKEAVMSDGVSVDGISLATQDDGVEGRRRKSEDDEEEDEDVLQDLVVEEER